MSGWKIPASFTVKCIDSQVESNLRNVKSNSNLSSSSPARDQSLISSLRSESVSEALDCSELVPGRGSRVTDKDVRDLTGCAQDLLTLKLWKLKGKTFFKRGKKREEQE